MTKGIEGIRSFTHPDTMKYGHRSTVTTRIVHPFGNAAHLVHIVRLPDDTTREFNDVNKAIDYAVTGVCLGAAGAALQELVTAVYGVCAPLLTASDGGAMWCAMRGRPGAEDDVKRLQAALSAAEAALGTSKPVACAMVPVEGA